MKLSSSTRKTCWICLLYNWRTRHRFTNTNHRQQLQWILQRAETTRKVNEEERSASNGKSQWRNHGCQRYSHGMAMYFCPFTPSIGYQAICWAGLEKLKGRRALASGVSNYKGDLTADRLIIGCDTVGRSLIQSSEYIFSSHQSISTLYKATRIWESFRDENFL